MAGPATRMILLQNGKSFPFHLLRGSLLRGSNAISVETTQFDHIKLHPQQKPIFNLHGDQPIAGVGAASNVDGVVNRRFGEFGKMGRVEAAKRVISDDDDEQDEEEDYSDVEFDDEMIEDMEDDDDEEGEDDSNLDGDDAIDVRKRK